MTGKEKKRERVIAAARDVMMQVGISKLTLDDVAERINMSPSSLYYYFAKKQDLLEAVMRYEMDRLLEILRTALERAEGPEEKLMTIGRTLVDELHKLYDFPGFTKESARKAEELVPEPVAAFRETHRKMLEEVLTDGSRQGVFEVQDIELTSFILAAGTYGVVQAILEPGTPKRLLTDMNVVERLLLDGLKKR